MPTFINVVLFALLLHSIDALPSLDNCVCVSPSKCYSYDDQYYNQVKLRSRSHVDKQCPNWRHICCVPTSVMQNDTMQALWLGCGTRNVNEEGGDFDEFPWVVSIHFQENNENTYQCTGTLIHPQVVLTAAHCVYDDFRTYSVRTGEWDRMNATEPRPHQEIAVDNIKFHPNYNPYMYSFDAALLLLEKPFNLSKDVNTVCLPSETIEMVNDQPCLGIGWGKDNFGPKGVYAPILKQIPLPFVESKRCEMLLRDELLDRSFELDESYLCAGGEEGIDLCTGDGGAPLVISNYKGNVHSKVIQMQIGIMSQGIECKKKNVPGLYTRIETVKPWIDDIMDSLKLDRSMYTNNKLTPRAHDPRSRTRLLS